MYAHIRETCRFTGHFQFEGIRLDRSWWVWQSVLMAKDWTLPETAILNIEKVYLWYREKGDSHDSALKKSVDVNSRKYWQIKKFIRFNENRKYTPEAHDAYEQFISDLASIRPWQPVYEDVA